MERIGLIAAVSTYQRPSAKWARRQPGSRGEIVELGAILGFKDRLLRCSRGEHLRLPEYGAYVRLPTRSGRRGGVLQVPLHEALPVTRGKRYMLLSSGLYAGRGLPTQAR
jgi:hypothetical protein